MTISMIVSLVATLFGIVTRMIQEGRTQTTEEENATLSQVTQQMVSARQDWDQARVDQLAGQTTQPQAAQSQIRPQGRGRPRKTENP